MIGTMETAMPVVVNANVRRRFEGRQIVRLAPMATTGTQTASPATVSPTEPSKSM